MRLLKARVAVHLASELGIEATAGVVAAFVEQLRDGGLLEEPANAFAVGGSATGHPTAGRRPLVNG